MRPSCFGSAPSKVDRADNRGGKSPRKCSRMLTITMARMTMPFTPLRGRFRWIAGVTATLTALLVGVMVVATAPAASAATVDTGTWYLLVNRNSGKALDVYNFSTADGGR